MYLRQKPSPLQVYIGKTTQSVRNRWFKQDAADLRREAQTPHWEKVNEILNHRGNMDAMEELDVQLVNAEKSVSGHVKKSTTSSFFNTITFYSAVKCKKCYCINR